MGLRGRQAQNERLRANGEEPSPGCGRGSGVKRWARYLKRAALTPIKIRNLERYLNASRRDDQPASET